MPKKHLDGTGYNRVVGKTFWILKKFLNKAGYNKIENEPRFQKGAFIDFIVVLAYTVISAILVIINQAQLVVLGLNCLCLIRAIIHNAYSTSKLTLEINNLDIKDKKRAIELQIITKGTHYHIRVVVLAAVLVFALMMFIMLSVHIHKGIEVGAFIKLMVILVLIAVMLDDFENIIVYVFDAAIKPIY